ncbi:MAG: nucleoside hydrolase [Proteobacteria bacterium]|nr:nucleoside hydrolase [Pseudomonadota bacterium]
MKARLIIDCDPGHDDALALMVAHHFAEVLLVTTVSGNAPVDLTTANALRVLDLLEVATPVYSGAAEPLQGAPRYALHVHGADGLGGVDLPPPGRPAASGAVSQLIDVCEANPDAWLVALGPLTNLAQMFRLRPDLAERLPGISIMGGSAAGGNATPVAEFNIFADPYAAAVVFESGARIRMCGLNLTRQVMSSAGWLDTFRDQNNPRARFVVQLLTFLHERMVHLTGQAAAALHDPCAVLAVTHQQLFNFVPRPVTVELTGRHTRAMTVVDERPLPGSRPNVEVGYTVDSAALLSLIRTGILAGVSSI